MSDKLHTKKSALIINKTDKAEKETIEELTQMGEAMEFPVITISALEKVNIETLTTFLTQSVHSNGYNESDTIITNLRHYESLTHAGEAIKRVIEGLNAGISGDLLSQDIRECLHYLGEITGEISTDEVLANMFKNFCIGK
jgi:tRNA modification GTPase